MSILIAVLLIILLKITIGYSTLSLIGVRNKICIDKALIVGWGILVLLLYSGPRFSISTNYASLLLLILILISLIIIVFQSKSLNYKKIKIDFNYLLISIPVILILVSPKLLNNQIFYQNWGPDLDGNLISMAYLKSGKGFTDLLSDFKNAYDGNWWESGRTDPWKLADQAHGIAIEFFIRSVRWGHAVEGNILNKLFNKDVWFGLYALMISSAIITQCFIYNNCIKLGFVKKYAVVLTLILGMSQSIVLMSFEGINVQLIYLPIFLYLIFNIDDLLKNNLIDKLIIVIALLTLIITFGEGVQIFISVLLIYLILNKNYNLKNTLRFIFTAALLSSIIFPTIIFDFIAWTYVRFIDGMDGGALHYKFSIINVILPLPYFKEPLVQGNEAIKLFFENSPLDNYISIVLLIWITYTFKRLINNYLYLISIYIVALIVIYTEHQYALWKYCVLFQSLIIIYSFRTILIKEKVITTIFLLIIFLINIYFLITTVLGYSKITRVVTKHQFSINSSEVKGCYGVVTPSSSPSYYRLGTVGELKLLHGKDRQFGLLPNFSKNSKDCDVAIYYDCDIEGIIFCNSQKNKNSLKPNHIYITKYKIKDVIKGDGYIDENIFKKIQNDNFTESR